MYSNSTSIASRRSRSSFSRGVSAVERKKGFRLGPVTHTIFIGVTLLILGLIYLTQAAKVTAFDYEANQIDTEISTLEQQKADLEVENARLTALSSIKSSEVASSMVEPTNISNIEN